MSDCRKCDHKSICIEWWNSEAATSFDNYGNVDSMNESWGASCTGYEGYRTPMKPHLSEYTWVCPNCFKFYKEYYCYCQNCGQAIDWEEEEVEE